jgi:hypothetical protein
MALIFIKSGEAKRAATKKSHQGVTNPRRDLCASIVEGNGDNEELRGGYEDDFENNLTTASCGFRLRLRPREQCFHYGRDFFPLFD